MEFNAYITNISGSWVLYYFICFSIHDSWINHTHILNSFKCIFHFTCTFSALSLFFWSLFWSVFISLSSRFLRIAFFRFWLLFWSVFILFYYHDFFALPFFVFGLFFDQLLFHYHHNWPDALSFFFEPYPCQILSHYYQLLYADVALSYFPFLSSFFQLYNVFFSFFRGRCYRLSFPFPYWPFVFYSFGNSIPCVKFPHLVFQHYQCLWKLT